MNWVECAKSSESIFGHSRFSPPVDGLAGFNCESGTTISDLTGGIAWLFTYVGDWVLRIPALNGFLEFEPNQTGGYLSGLISFVILSFTLVVAGLILDAIAGL
jgi:hypothetical protein